MKKNDWSVNARFGLFLHRGLYSIPAKGEWSCTRDPGKTGDVLKIVLKQGV